MCIAEESPMRANVIRSQSSWSISVVAVNKKLRRLSTVRMREASEALDMAIESLYPQFHKWATSCLAAALGAPITLERTPEWSAFLLCFL